MNKKVNASSVLVLTGGGYRTTAHEPSCLLHRNKKKKGLATRSELSPWTKACASCKPTWESQTNKRSKV